MHSVYPIFAHAGRNWRAGSDLYGAAARGSYDLYRYSPLAAACFSLLSAAPDRLGDMVWRVVNAAVFLGGLHCFHRGVLKGVLDQTGRALLLALTLPLAVNNLGNGQCNLLLAGLLMLAAAAAAREAWPGAAACVAAAALLKIYPLAFGLLLALLFFRRFSVWLLAMMAAGLALPFLLAPASYVAAQYAGWLTYLRSAPVEHPSIDLRSLAGVAGMSFTPRAYSGIQLAAAALIALFVRNGERRGWPRERLLTLTLGLTCCWMTLLGPATEAYTYFLVAPVAVWTLLKAWAQGDSPWRLGLLAGIYLLLAVAQGLAWLPRSYQEVPITLALAPLATLLLAGMLIRSPGRRVAGPARVGEELVPAPST
jgi:hypothetical protein